MTSDQSSHTLEQEFETEEEEQQHVHDIGGPVVVRRDGMLSNVFRRLSQFWPVNIVVRACRGVLWMFGFTPRGKPRTSSSATAPGRHSVTGRKRLNPFTRLLLSVLPRRIQSVMGYPVSTSIGCSLSPEMRVSPTKPCGKGSKRKQDELYDDEDPEQQTWVGILNRELCDSEDSEEDPDYHQPSTIETETEEYCSRNSTESDIELSDQGLVIIEDLTMEDPPTVAN